MTNRLDGTPIHEMTTLASGVRVLSTTLPHTNAVSAILLFGAGSRYETDELAGASHLFEHLLFKGTTNRPTPREISEVIEGVGGALNAFTDREMTGYWCRVPKPHWVDGLDVLTDMCRNALFRDDDIDREKQVVFEEIRASYDSPEARAEILLDDLLWPEQPLGRDIAGTVDSVQAVSRDAMLGYLATQYVPSNTIVAVAGGVQHRDVVTEVGRMLDGWGDRVPIEFSPAEDKLKGPGVKIEHRPTEQAHVAIGLHGLPVNDPARYALRLLSVTLGESMSSRLFEEVREKRGLAYSIHSAVAGFKDTGVLHVGCGTDPSRAQEAIQVIAGELAKIREGISEPELSAAKALSKGRIMLRMEESRSVAMSTGAQELMKRKVETIQDMLDAIDAVTLDEIRAVAARVISPHKLAMAMVGPFEDEAAFRDALTF